MILPLIILPKKSPYPGTTEKGDFEILAPPPTFISKGSGKEGFFVIGYGAMKSRTKGSSILFSGHIFTLVTFLPGQTSSPLIFLMVTSMK